MQRLILCHKQRKIPVWHTYELTIRCQLGKLAFSDILFLIDYMCLLGGFYNPNNKYPQAVSFLKLQNAVYT